MSNRNANVISTCVRADGSTVVIKHRNTFMGWVNAVKRAGFDPIEFVHSFEGMPESDRVA